MCSLLDLPDDDFHTFLLFSYFHAFSSTTLLGFSWTLNTISAGCGTLINLYSDPSITGLTNVVFSGSSGVAINVTYVSCLDLCIDSSSIDTSRIDQKLSKIEDSVIKS